MQDEFLKSISLPEFSLWEKIKNQNRLISFDLEITARCNNNCRHCYINLPAQDKSAQKKELTPREIKNIVDQAVSCGALWCLITGGEPFLRKDFSEIYLYLKQKGLLVSVFTNATLINQEQIKLFKKYPPRDIEVTVYGVTEETYERVTRVRGSFSLFMRGLELLLKNNIKVRFKAMALRSNVNELKEISSFCRKRTKDYFRFDPFLHLRFDQDQARNKEIKSERLLSEEIIAIEQQDAERFDALKKGCDKLIVPEFANFKCNHIFLCGTGNGSFCAGYDGFFRLCSSLWHPDCIFDLKQVSLKDALENFVPKVRQMCSERKEFLSNCRACPIVNLCIWCPAHSYLETQELDKPVEYFCKVANARKEMINGAKLSGD